MVARSLSGKSPITDYARLRRAPRAPGHGGAFQAQIGIVSMARGDFTIPPRLADMIITDITWTPASPAPGDHVVFSAVVQNIGAQPTPAGTIVDCLFTVSQGGTQVMRTWEDNQTAAIAPGASATLVANGGDTPGANYWTATAGTFDVLGYVNGNARFPEADRNNNFRSETISVSAASGVPSSPVLNAVPGNGTVALSWNAPANNGSGIIAYRVRRDGNILNPPNTTTTALVYTDNTVVNNVSYSYTVAAVNANGEGPPSAPVAAVPFTGTGVPALPADILNATPANKLFGWGGNFHSLAPFSTYDSWKSQWGFSGFSTKVSSWKLVDTLENMTAYFYHTGTDVTAVVDPLNISASYNSTFAYHHTWMGNKAPPVEGGTWGQKHNPPGFGIGDYKRAHPDYYFFVGLYMRSTQGNEAATNPYMGDWYDDTHWTGMTRTISNWAAGAELVGADGLTFDCETSGNFGAFPCTSTTRPSTVPGSYGGGPTLYAGFMIRETDTGLYQRWTGSAWQAKTASVHQTQVEARGFQFGQGIWNNFPDCQVMVYEWRTNGGIYASKNYADYPGGTFEQDWFFYGMMRAMQVAGGTKSYWWHWDDEYYELGHVPFAHMQRSLQNELAILSQRLPTAVRDFMLSRFAIIMPSWAYGSTSNRGYWYPIPEPEFANQQALYRKWSMGGWRSEYNLGGGLPSGVNPNDATLGPTGATGTPAQNVYTDSRANPPGGHSSALTAGMSATTQDSTPIQVGPIGQTRAFNTVTLSFTAGHIMGIKNVHWKLYASNGTTIASQGEAVMVMNENGGTTSTNYNNAFMQCTCTIPNATAGLYVVIDAYSIVAQRTSRRVQML